MIEYIAVTNFRGERLEMPMSNPYGSGLAIMDVEGLGPAKGTINATDISSSDGALFNSSRIGKREIVLSLRFIDNPSNDVSIEDLRLKTYYYFPVKKFITFEVKTDNRHVVAYGYVESNTPDIFSKEEGCDIKIICPDPHFYGIGESFETEQDFSTVHGGFEFAFKNESLTQKLLKFADLQFLERVNLVYSGDMESGVIIRMTAVGPAEMPRIVKPDEFKSIKIDTKQFAKYGTASFIAGDEMIIDTRIGHKRISLIRDGVTHNAINSLDRESQWLTVHPGDNIFSYDTSVGASNLRISIQFVNTYEGV